MNGPRLEAVAAAALACGWLASAPPAAAQTGDPERGRALYYEHGCYGCHGFNGETGAWDLVGTNSPLVETFDAFLTFLRLRADQAPLFPSTRMPNYPDSALDDTAARDVFAYVRTFRLDRPETEDVPALRAILESAERPYRASAAATD
jgi:mono/diheme cytochrome c family protein